MKNCTGSLKHGKTCLKCDRCFNYFKKFVLKRRRIPLNQFEKTEAMMFVEGINVVAMKLGPRGFQEFVRGGK